ncbi:MAG: endonuclease V [Candidatus Bipolaricaulota bacterium]|nr:endonuclease V [Candidatus Bipolaricaulota bacterium]MCS7274866.1 endonuclease V [Candidatus Bipolaricaulota bacterium]MDW8111145.1 endonuclease V [Candidatus Bipolaricaulota bacterium]MDW8329595.1 endonuclease V [Candidatus Bipolaricaulota bacterium]
MLPDIETITLELVAQIPKGRVATFREIALALGDPIAARAVGSILAQHKRDSPSHRVVSFDGRVTEEQAKLLQAEGVPIKDGRVLSLNKFLFREFRSDKPLQRLQQIQHEIRARMRLAPDRKEYRTVGGIDLSYAGEHGVAAYARLELESLRVLDTQTLAQTVRFPYIPSYLAFRELPVMLALLHKLKDQNALADMTFVDGTGTLHHRQAGIASQLGVMLDIPTIGITKSLLHGEPEIDLKTLAPNEICYIRIAGERAGAALRPSEDAEPFFISPGHRVDLETAIELTLRTLTSDSALPVPIQHAHETSRRAAQALKQQTAQTRKSSQLGLFDKL